jgi:hypothetical protein
MSTGANVIRPARGPRWTRKRLTAMLLDCYGPTPRGAVDVAAVAHYAGVSPSTVRRWLSRPEPGGRRLAIPKRRLVQLQRGPEEVERRNEQQYRHALNALASIDDERSIMPEWRKQGWLEQQTVAWTTWWCRPDFTPRSSRTPSWFDSRRGESIPPRTGFRPGARKCGWPTRRPSTWPRLWPLYRREALPPSRWLVRLTPWH